MKKAEKFDFIDFWFP